LIYQGLEEENLDQKTPGPPGWGLMKRASSSLIVKKQEMLKNQTPRSFSRAEKLLAKISALRMKPFLAPTS